LKASSKTKRDSLPEQEDLNIISPSNNNESEFSVPSVPSKSPVITQESPDTQEFNIESLIEAELPDNWKVEYDPSGKIYYRNVLTNETSWEIPDNFSKIEEYVNILQNFYFILYIFYYLLIHLLLIYFLKLLIY